MFTEAEWAGGNNLCDKRRINYKPTEFGSKEWIKEQNREADKRRKEKKMTEKEKNGLYPKKLTDKTPEWIVCSFGIKLDELPAPNEKGYINIDICKSQYGGYYPKINDYKKPTNEENIVKFNDNGSNEVPF